jgi:hypothetical protein
MGPRLGLTDRLLWESPVGWAYAKVVPRTTEDSHHEWISAGSAPDHALPRHPSFHLPGRDWL